MISRSQKNEKSSPPPPPPPREHLSGGGCQLILDLVGQIPLLMKKKFFLFNFIKIVKNVEGRIFDKRLCYFYISAFLFWQNPFFRLF